MSVIDDLFDIIEKRRGADKNESYVAKMFAKGTKKIGQKVGEEAVETVIAGVAQSREDLIDESADLLFHLLILWSDRGVTPKQVMKELEERMNKGRKDTTPGAAAL